jgi:hypothetical protein
MKSHSIIFFLLAMASYIHACGCTTSTIKSQAYVYPISEGSNEYPTDIPKGAPVNQAGYTPYGVSAYTSLVPQPTYVTPPGTHSYAYGSYTPYVPEPSPVGVPPVPYYSKNTTTYKIVAPVYSTHGYPLYPSYRPSGIASPTEIAPGYTTYTSVTTIHTSTNSTSTATALPTQVSSASMGMEVQWISWMFTVMVGGIGVGIGLQIRY